jgi:hypothetical protein
MKQSKGSIGLLEEWLNKTIEFPDPAPKNAMIKTFRDIQKLRSKGKSHKEIDDDHNKEYMAKQRHLMIRAYGAVRTMRLILQNHPASESVEVPDWLFKGEICSY